MGLPISLRDTLRKKGKDYALHQWSSHRHKTAMLIKRPSSALREQACRAAICVEVKVLHLSFCRRDRVSGQSGVSSMDTGVSVPPRVKINLSIIMMRLNRMLMIKTHNNGQDEDKNRDYCQGASNSYSMKPTLVD